MALVHFCVGEGCILGMDALIPGILMDLIKDIMQIAFRRGRITGGHIVLLRLGNINIKILFWPGLGRRARGIS